jgi:glutaconate CoA-transferase subunit B
VAVDYTLDELFAVLIARDLRPEDRVIMVGAGLPAARAGAAMANMSRIPDARVILGLSVENLAEADTAPEVLPLLFDPRTLERGEAYMFQHEVFDDMSWPDVFFLGGFQVDRRGNVNMLGIRAGARWALHGPGALAQATMSTYCRGYYVLMARHDQRTFVERVSCITALGDRERRREFQLPGGGPRLIISPLGVFDLDEDGEMRVVSLHERATPEQLRESTGFDLELPSKIPSTAPPTGGELALLRERIDIQGVLRGGNGEDA